MTIFLSGGGSGKDSREIDIEFVKRINKEKPVLYIPLAGEPPYSSCLEWIRSNFKPYNFDNFYMVKTAEELKQLNLENFSAIYIGGGNTYKLLADLQKIEFLKKLNKYLLGGGLFYGGSAGAIILGRDIRTSQDPIKIGLKDFSGLNLLEGMSIFCHFNKGEKKKIVDYQNKYEEIIVAIPETSGLVVSDNSIRCIGSKEVIFFEKDGEKILIPGQKFSLETFK